MAYQMSASGMLPNTSLTPTCVAGHIRLVRLYPTYVTDDTQVAYVAHTATGTTREGLRATHEYVRAYSTTLTVLRERLRLRRMILPCDEHVIR